MIREIVGGLVFGVIVIATVAIARWLTHAMLDYEPHCVYRIPLLDGRVYYGHAKDKDLRLRRHRQTQRALPEGHPRKWWDQVPPHVRDAKPLRMPDEWVVQWYRSKAVSEQMEQKMIREAEARGEATANVIKYKGAVSDDAA